MFDFPLIFAFLAFLVFFLAVWFGSLFGIAMIGGWRGLATKYEATGPPQGRRFEMQSLNLGNFTGYGSCVTMHLSEAGLHLRPLFLFQFGHKPLLIPWSEFGEARFGRFLWIRRYTFRIGGEKGQQFTLHEKIYLEAKPYLSR